MLLLLLLGAILPDQGHSESLSLKCQKLLLKISSRHQEAFTGPQMESLNLALEALYHWNLKPTGLAPAEDWARKVVILTTDSFEKSGISFWSDFQLIQKYLLILGVYEFLKHHPFLIDFHSHFSTPTTEDLAMISILGWSLMNSKNPEDLHQQLRFIDSQSHTFGSSLGKMRYLKRYAYRSLDKLGVIFESQRPAFELFVKRTVEHLGLRVEMGLDLESEILKLKWAHVVEGDSAATDLLIVNASVFRQKKIPAILTYLNDKFWFRSLSPLRKIKILTVLQFMLRKAEITRNSAQSVLLQNTVHYLLFGSHRFELFDECESKGQGYCHADRIGLKNFDLPDAMNLNLNVIVHEVSHARSPYRREVSIFYLLEELRAFQVGWFAEKGRPMTYGELRKTLNELVSPETDYPEFSKMWQIMIQNGDFESPADVQNQIQNRLGPHLNERDPFIDVPLNLKGFLGALGLNVSSSGALEWKDQRQHQYAPVIGRDGNFLWYNSNSMSWSGDDLEVVQNRQMR